MRPKAGDPPRNMTQKILASRADGAHGEDALVPVKVDQVVLSRAPNRVLALADALGMKKPAVETAVAYDTTCVTLPEQAEDRGAEQVPAVEGRVSALATQRGVLVGRAGIGFPAAVHLERFACPARLAVTDDPRMAGLGGAGMLTFLVSPLQAAVALTTGVVELRAPRTIQILFSGRIRPFICVRDVSLELLRRGLRELVRQVDERTGAPVVLEFAGPSARTLTVQDRGSLASLAAEVGAASATFLSDEKTEVFLRDQRRSKAHRLLAADPGAPCEEVLTVDLSAVDPLIMDETGRVRPVRDLAGQPVEQVLLGGDWGASLCDLLAAAALLKSKRVPSHVDLLLAPPSRQVLEVLATTGALVDLVATGARLVEPDSRLLSGGLYPPFGEASLSTFTAEPTPPGVRRALIASAETAAYAVAYGKLGDPRGFKRPVRVSVPRTLPTDDVLVARKARVRPGKAEERTATRLSASDASLTEARELAVIADLTAAKGPSLLVTSSHEALRVAAQAAAAGLAPHLSAVLAPWVPAGLVGVLSGAGVLALAAPPSELAKLQGIGSLRLPAASDWPEGAPLAVEAGTGEAAVTVALTCLARGAERQWLRPDALESTRKKKGKTAR